MNVSQGLFSVVDVMRVLLPISWSPSNVPYPTMHVEAEAPGGGGGWPATHGTAGSLGRGTVDKARAVKSRPHCLETAQQVRIKGDSREQVRQGPQRVPTGGETSAMCIRQ